MTVPFVHLRLHSEYSLVDGLVKLKSLVSTTAERAMPALALTDETNLFGPGGGVEADYWQRLMAP